MNRIIMLSLITAALTVGNWAFAGPTTTRISVKVLKTTAKGKSWDSRRGAPDIAICVSYEDMDRSTGKMNTECFPRQGKTGHKVVGNWKKVKRAKCRNAYSCSFKNIVVPAKGKFEVHVFDVDWRSNDMIGSDFCEVGKTCKVGRSVIKITGPAAKAVKPAK